MPDMCSTPEGIGAEIGHIQMGASPLELECSTPEGIGAEIGGTHRDGVRRNSNGVLNARGHRSGDRHPRTMSRFARHDECSTPEGIGAEIGLTPIRSR